MAKAPVPGTCKTRLARQLGESAAAQLYAAMLADRLEAVSAQPAGRRVILAAPEEGGFSILRTLAPPDWEVVVQRGEDLGARLANAFRDLLRGNDLVCILDSDSPTLPLSELWPSLSAPRAPHSVMLGACEDGGYYLIGMRVLAPTVFEGIPWSTGAVAGATREKCRAVGLDVVDLVEWYDVDEGADLERLRRDLRDRPELAPRTAAFLAGRSV
jgi:rSAM/selenodomain-associated transferase 1